jgi:hypothetical protein
MTLNWNKSGVKRITDTGKFRIRISRGNNLCLVIYVSEVQGPLERQRSRLKNIMLKEIRCEIVNLNEIN